jgi:hypothetical protein
MNRALIAVIVVGVFASQRAVAQAVAPAGVVNRPVVADTSARPTRSDAFLTRSLRGTLGFLGGAAVGGILGKATAGERGPYCGNTEPPTLCPSDPLEDLPAVLTGIALGGALGASLAASIPTLSEKCSLGARMLRSTVGSAVGAALGAAITANGSGVVVVLPLGSVLGASTALIGC